MKQVFSKFEQINQWFEQLPAVRLFRVVMYWGTILVSSLIIIFTVYHIQAIPVQIEDRVEETISERPWTMPFMVVDGRDVYLRGKIEPDSSIEYEISRIRALEGIRNIYNFLEEQPQPSPYLSIVRDSDLITLRGRLTGDYLESVVQLINDQFHSAKISDRIQIDDRLGRPLWLDGIKTSIGLLKDLKHFEFHGWRDQIQLSGVVADLRQSMEIEFSFPASMIAQVNIDNRLRVEPVGGFSLISLRSDWSGTHVSGRLPSRDESNKLMAMLRKSFGNDVNGENLEVDHSLYSVSALDKLIRLMPTLSQVRNLQVDSSHDRFSIWGVVDDPYQLGLLLLHIDQLDMARQVDNFVLIDPADTPATLSVFTDHKRATLMGTLPSIKSRELIHDILKVDLSVSLIRDFTTTEPNIANSSWIGQWKNLVSVFPDGPVGLTIDENHVLITGTVHSQQHMNQIDLSLEDIFPEKTRLNWSKLVQKTN